MIQCFVKHAYEPVFTGENQPRLLYVSKIDPAESAYPRVTHLHKDFVELILVRSGVSKYFIDDRQQYICPGGRIVYNSSVLHDEGAWAEHKVSIYCIAIGGLAVPGLRKNALLPDNAPPVHSFEHCLPEIADALHISAPYLSHVFRQAFGYSPMNYLNRRRVGEAQTLLITAGLSITEIDERAGYETTSYFSTHFTKQVGMSPKKYRKTYVVRHDSP